MTSWRDRSFEEKALLTPSFCGCLLWHAARGYLKETRVGLPFVESFLVLPIILHRGTRDALPRNVRTSLPVWLQENALARGRIASRAQLLVPFTKEALIFAGVHGLIKVENGEVQAANNWTNAITRNMNGTSEEVRACYRRAEFLGRWFATTGSAPTVLALIGVRP